MYVALKHFSGSLGGNDSSLGEVHYNEAISLDKQWESTVKRLNISCNFSRKGSNGNKAILAKSKILLSHSLNSQRDEVSSNNFNRLNGSWKEKVART